MAAGVALESGQHWLLSADRRDPAEEFERLVVSEWQPTPAGREVVERARVRCADRSRP